MSIVGMMFKALTPVRLYVTRALDQKVKDTLFEVVV